VTEPDDGEDFTPLAIGQYEAINDGDDVELAQAMFDACELIVNHRAVATGRSGSYTSPKYGLLRRLPFSPDMYVYLDSGSGLIVAIV